MTFQSINSLKAKESQQLAIKMLLLISQIFGAAPANLLNISSSLKRQRIKYFLHIVWSFILILIILTAIYFQYKTYLVKEDFLERLSFGIEYGFNMSNCILIMIGCNYQKKCYSKYLELITKIDRNILICGEKRNTKKTNMFIVKISTIFAVILLLDCGVVYVYVQYYAVKSFAVILVDLIPNITILLGIIQYLGLLYIVKEGYKQTNIILTKFLQTFSNESKELSTNMVVMLSKDKVGSDFVKIIKIVQVIYYDVTELEKNTCQSFGIFTISQLASSFIMVTTELYSFYVVCKTEVSILSIMYTSTWILLHSGKSLAILILNSKVTSEVIYYFFFTSFQ